MKNTLNWTNANPAATGIRVYRDTKAIVKTALPAVYATLPGTATSFEDNNIVRGTTYYYMLEVYLGTDSIFSSSISMLADRYTGPGYPYVVTGDVDVGFCGLTRASDLISWNAFLAWANIPGTSVSGTTVDNQWWVKFAYRGKILFIPFAPIATGSWRNIYAAGLVYGVDGPGPRDYNTYAAVNQLRTIVINNTRYKVRLMTGLPPGFDLTKNFIAGTANTQNLGTTAKGGNTFDSYDSIYDLSGSEWNDLIVPMTGWGASTKKQKGFGYAPGVANLSWNYTGSSGMDGTQLFQEMLPSKQIISRGYQATLSYHPCYAKDGISTTGSAYYRPVLEMLP